MEYLVLNIHSQEGLQKDLNLLSLDKWKPILVWDSKGESTLILERKK